MRWSLLIPFLFSMAWADTVTRRPDADGNYTELTPDSGTDHFAMVDEAVADDGTTFNATAVHNKTDTYLFPTTPAVPAGATNIVVTVYFRVQEHSGKSISVTPLLRFDGTDLEGTPESLDGVSWTTFDEVIGKPGGGAWSVAEINGTGWEAGVGFVNFGGQITQLYVEIDYTPAVGESNPVIMNVTIQ